MSGIGLALSGLSIAGRLTGAKAALAKVPPKVWLYIAIAVAAVALIFAHQHHAHKALKAQYTAGYAQRGKDDAAALQKAIAAAQAWKQKFDQTNVKLSQALKEKHDEKVTTVGNTVAGILHDGPGKATCGRLDYPSAPASPGRTRPPAGSGAPADPQVLDSGGPALIALPFNDVTRLFGQCDINRDEADKWREQRSTLERVWPAH